MAVKYADRLAPRSIFLRRLATGSVAAAALMLVTLCVGTFGYHLVAQLAWVDAFHQASLLMSGMGPLDERDWTTAAKIFDSLYALFCGMVLLVATGVLFVPVLHRLMHKFHLEDARDK